MGENDAVKRQGKLYGKRTSTSLNVVKHETYQLQLFKFATPRIAQDDICMVTAEETFIIVRVLYRYAV